MEEEIFNVIITLMYNDGSTRNVTFSGVNEDELPYVKRRIGNINNDVPENFQKTFVSSSGALCMKISGAKVVAIQEEVIYNAS